MKNYKIERFKRRQVLKQKIEEKRKLSIVRTVDSSTKLLVEKHSNSFVDTKVFNQYEKVLDEKYNFDLTDTNVKSNDVNKLIKSLQSEYDKEKMNLLVNDCKNTVLDNIIKPFGVGKFIVAKYDKTGGNVTTINNFEKGIVATAADKTKQEEWKKSNTGKFDREPYDKQKKLNKKEKTVTQQFNSTKKKHIYDKMKDGDKVIDGYTGNNLGVKSEGTINKNQQIDLEHITPVSEIERDSKNHLYACGNNREERQKDRVNLATDDNNLTLVEGGMNSSKNDKDLLKWAGSSVSKQHAKETGNSKMTNAEYYGTDKNLLKREYNKSKDFIAREQKQKQLTKQGEEILSTGAGEGVKMGLQQAVGLVLKELTEGIFDEISDIYKNGFRGQDKMDKTFFLILKERLNRIGTNILIKWKDVVKAFGKGFFSGLLSNLITVVINMFVTTGKRVVRMIREGFFSLLKAVKMLFFPPVGMTLSEAAHESTKLIAAGLAVSGGIILEQYLETILKAIPFSEMISAVISGIVTGLGTALIVYLLDKMDLFGIEKGRKEDFVIQKLNDLGDSYINETEALLEQLKVAVI